MALSQDLAKAVKKLEHVVFQQRPAHYMLDITCHSRHLVGVAARLLKDNRAVAIRQATDYPLAGIIGMRHIELLCQHQDAAVPIHIDSVSEDGRPPTFHVFFHPRKHLAGSRRQSFRLV